jgi:hypothetical protein
MQLRLQARFEDRAGEKNSFAKGAPHNSRKVLAECCGKVTPPSRRQSTRFFRAAGAFEEA